MPKITLRSDTPLGLTNQQVDDNFTNLNNSIYQVAGTNLYPDFDLTDSSFYSADSGATYSFVTDTSPNGGLVKLLKLDTSGKSVYTGWFNVQPNTEYVFSSIQKVVTSGYNTANVYVEFASVSNFDTKTFTPTTKTLVASNSTSSFSVGKTSLKSGTSDRRARFVFENIKQTKDSSVYVGEFRCSENQNLISNSGGLKNHIINGNFDFWQRGLTQTNDGYGSADRWSLDIGGSGVTYSMSRENVTAPAFNGLFARYCAKITVSGMIAGTGRFVKLTQKIEDIRRFYGKPLALSFWAKSSIDGKKIETSLYSPHSDAVFTPTTNTNIFTLTSGWVKYTVNFSASTKQTSGNNVYLPLVLESTDSPTYLNLMFNLSSGNVVDSSYLNNCDIFIAQVQLEHGTTSTEFDWRHSEIEEKLCKRYFEFIEEPISGMGTGGNGRARPNYRFLVPKRAVPSITLGSLTSPAIYTSASGAGTITNIVPVDITKNGINEMSISCNVNIATGSFTTTKIPLKVDAEI